MNSLFKITILILISSSFSFATADGPDHYRVQGVASNDVLWMHPTPDYRSKRIGKIPYNARCLINFGCEGRWCKVKYRGILGWVNGKFLGESGNCSQASYSGSSQHKQKSSHPGFTKQMLQGKVLQTQKYGSALTVKFIPSQFKSFDGDMIFHFSSNDPEQDERLSYRLISGKILYYGYDGSKHRMTLHSSSPSSWVIMEEEDMDGDDRQFGFGQAKKIVYKIQKSSTVLPLNGSQLLPTGNLLPDTSSYGAYDQLYMQIYGRLDTRIASRRDYLEEINKFLNTASSLLIKKHKLDIKMQEIRHHQMAAVAAPPEVTGLMNALGSIENLDGSTIIDYDGNKLTTMAELKQAYSKAIKKSMQFQRDNYVSEKERTNDFIKLKELLIRSGSDEQKNDIKNAEIKQLQGSYRYYKKLLDDSSVWCMTDKDTSQEKPLFYPKFFIIERLYQKYEVELSRSHDSYDPKDLSQRAKKIEEKSQKIKHQFNRNYLYELRTKPHRIKNLF